MERLQHYYLLCLYLVQKIFVSFEIYHLQKSFNYALLPTSHLALTILTPRVDSVKLSWIYLMGQNKEQSQEVKSSQYLQLLYLQTLPLLTNKGEYGFLTHAMKSPAKMLYSQHVGPKHYVHLRRSVSSANMLTPSIGTQNSLLS